MSFQTAIQNRRAPERAQVGQSGNSASGAPNQQECNACATLQGLSLRIAR